MYLLVAEWTPVETVYGWSRSDITQNFPVLEPQTSFAADPRCNGTELLVKPLPTYGLNIFISTGLQKFSHFG